MSRVSSCCQTVPYFAPSAPPSCQLPSHASPAAVHEERSSQQGMRLLQQTASRQEEARGKAIEAAGPGEAARWVDMTMRVLDAAHKLSAPVLDAGSQIGGGIGHAAAGAAVVMEKVSCVLTPIASIWSLLSGLSRIGQVHLEAQAAAEHRALQHGFAETLGRALDQPGLQGHELEQAARQARHPAHFGGLAATEIRISDRWRREFATLEARYLDGASLAIKVAERLTVDERRALAARLAAKLEGESSADRIYSFITIGRGGGR